MSSAHRGAPSAPQFILASTSPRRNSLLREAGYRFTVRAPAGDESSLEHHYASSDPLHSGRRMVQEIALMKARSAPASETEIVLAADTVVVSQCGELLGKPSNRADARRMIELLSGKKHFVHTGVAVKYGDFEKAAADTAEVHFRSLTASEVDEYVASGEGDDKAGAYAYQGEGRRLIDSVEGDYQTVIGLPLRIVAELIEACRVAGATS